MTETALLRKYRLWKPWLKTLLLPHLCTVLLLALIVLPQAAMMVWNGKAAWPDVLLALLSPLLLWLLGGTAAWLGMAGFPNVPPEYTVAVLSVIAAALVAGCLKRRTATGRRLVSLAVWLWFAYGFLVLGVQG